jgi:hypothetical protein
MGILGRKRKTMAKTMSKEKGSSLSDRKLSILESADYRGNKNTFSKKDSSIIQTATYGCIKGVQK